jgi:hypothetical protein
VARPAPVRADVGHRDHRRPAARRRLYGFDQTWLTLGFIGWGISFLFGVGFYPREGAKREKLIEQNGMANEQVATSINRVLTVATVDTLVVLLVVIDMTTKPGL